jgi:hypothetical protein
VPARSRAPANQADAENSSGFLRNECDPLVRIMAAEMVRTAARLQTRLAIMRCHREDVAPRMRLPSDSKSPPPVSRGGL